MNEEEAAAIAAFLVSVVKYCHKNEIIIRNLRPELIVFEEEKGLDVKLIDLSLAVQKEKYVDNHADPLYEHY